MIEVGAIAPIPRYRQFVASFLTKNFQTNITNIIHGLAHSIVAFITIQKFYEKSSITKALSAHQ